MMSAQGGGHPRTGVGRKFCKGGCVKMQTRGEGVKKIQNVCRSYLYISPYINDVCVVSLDPISPYPRFG